MKYKLVCFDFDGTLTTTAKNGWQLFHDAFETQGEKRQKAFQNYKEGNITYFEWAQHDFQMWMDLKLTKKDFENAVNNTVITKTPGTDEVLQELKTKGVKIAIISGSFSMVLEKLFPDAETFFDDLFINHLIFDEQNNLKALDFNHYDVERKAEAVKNIAKREGIPLEECAFIGDGYNDELAVQEVGLGIAFNSKEEKLRSIADIVIDKPDLREILQYLK